MHNITANLLENQDLNYKKFHAKIVPDTKLEIIGVRMPVIRKIVKSTSREDAVSFFVNEHKFYEEYLVHGLLIAKIKNADEFYPLLNEFLPFIDNWAICDTVASSIKKAATNRDLLFNNITTWLKSENVYTVRFGIVCLLSYFIEQEYSEKTINLILNVKKDEYYINMAIAWLFSVMLVKDYNAVIGLIESKTLPSFIQNKTIDKARDSFRIEKSKKEYLKTLKIKE